MKYGVILADPPWHFVTYTGAGTPHRTKKDHYQVVPTVELAKLPVAEWALPDCALFMWAVDSHLKQAIELGEAWGFTYKTVAFVWSKAPRIGMGYWTRKQTEQCLLFTKGKPRRLSASVRQLIEERPREHSRKPEEVYPRIEALVGGPYLELFARRSDRPGWDAWGDQTTLFNKKEAA
jgi:N6-adenosine-specific RNA methylase IME4